MVNFVGFFGNILLVEWFRKRLHWEELLPSQSERSSLTPVNLGAFGVRYKSFSAAHAANSFVVTRCTLPGNSWSVRSKRKSNKPLGVQHVQLAASADISLFVKVTMSFWML